MTETMNQLRRVTTRIRMREEKQKADTKLRDDLVRQARGEGEQPTAIAQAADVTRGRVHQILSPAKSDAA